MRAPHTLDCRVQPCDRAALARDETSRGQSLPLGMQAAPKRTRRLTIVDTTDSAAVQAFAFKREDDILVLHVFRPAEAGEVLGPPPVEEPQERLKAWVVYACQVPLMARDECRMLVMGSSRFACRHPERVGGLVP